MTLYIFSALDQPHTRHPNGSAQTRCGRPLLGAKEITEEQALVWLDDRRCLACVPVHAQHVTQMKARAA